MMMCGGASSCRAPSEEEKRLLLPPLSAHLEGRLGKSPQDVEIIEVRTQTVAGTNYFLKVKHSDGKVCHVRVFKALPCNGGDIEVVKVVEKSGLGDPLEYF
uniref:Cysteine protease inhibitor n=1 Tax=Spirometra erinaceieuropaei TaxID=99802 RepID=A0A067XIP6_SPIER|nr:cysteine protease inhibitor [Spirometra erinaceieuropaei]